MGDRTGGRLHSEGSIVGVGGATLRWQAWTPEGPSRARVALAHGMGEHGGRYADLAGRLVDAGYAVYALDHRAHGRSDGRRALIERPTDLVDDFGTFVAEVVEPAGDGQVFVLGHSLGGWGPARPPR